MNAAMVFDAMPGLVKTAPDLLKLMHKCWSSDRAITQQLTPALHRLLLLCASNYAEQPRARKASVKSIREHEHEALLRAAWTVAYWNQCEHAGNLSDFGFSACLASIDHATSDYAGCVRFTQTLHSLPFLHISRTLRTRHAMRRNGSGVKGRAMAGSLTRRALIATHEATGNSAECRFPPETELGAGCTRRWPAPFDERATVRTLSPMQQPTGRQCDVARFSPTIIRRMTRLAPNLTPACRGRTCGSRQPSLAPQ